MSTNYGERSAKNDAMETSEWNTMKKITSFTETSVQTKKVPNNPKIMFVNIDIDKNKIAILFQMR